MRRALVLFGVVPAAAAAVLIVTPSAGAVADRLPDLGMAQVADVRIEKSGARRLLRYSTTIVNVGGGPFELEGQRSSTSEPSMSVVQRIYDDGGGSRIVTTSAAMTFGGDGHNHWHVLDLETSELVRLDNGVKVGTGAKRGFCFFDNVAYRLTLPDAPQSPVYPGCGTATSLRVTTGLSIGWGDLYRWNLPDQYVDITGLVAGRYRLFVHADAQARFVESNESNNRTWVDLQIKGNGQPKILGYGPVA